MKSTFWWNPDSPVFDAVWKKNHSGNNSGGPSVADDYAALTRKQWSDYLNVLGVPQENQLIEYATNPATVTNAMSEASSDVNKSFDRQAGITSQRLQGLGLTLSPEEQAAQTLSSGLARSVADVGAQNRTRDQTIARQQSVIGNPVPTLGGLK